MVVRCVVSTRHHVRDQKTKSSGNTDEKCNNINPFVQQRSASLLAQDRLLVRASQEHPTFSALHFPSCILKALKFMLCTEGPLPLEKKSGAFTALSLTKVAD